VVFTDFLWCESVAGGLGLGIVYSVRVKRWDDGRHGQHALDGMGRRLPFFCCWRLELLRLLKKNNHKLLFRSTAGPVVAPTDAPPL